MQAAVRKLGNSASIVIPKSVLSELGLGAGDAVDLRLEDGRLILAPVRRAPRAGWADAARAIAAAGDGTPIWPEFGNVGDSDLAW
ncbi:MAG TPA: AbrB/MazE/SpoVT family DNA-binding domain-containing protein [Acetobacteraceae bacterium]|nr:AbrB/MazE/SpoVT family DNA-binding domain-containing protein [Acetobacteraceae bacterium]